MPAPRVRKPGIRIGLATGADIAGIVQVRVRAAEDLTQRFGGGPWSGHASERGVALDLRQGKVLVARRGARIVGTLKIGTRKPWAIDPSYFTPARRPWYLTNMAVDPGVQRLGIGTTLVLDAAARVREWGGDAVWLDAYDDPNAGAGRFYEKCGFTEVGRRTYRVTPLVYYELRVGS
ncbi:MAG: GNAT family N-acetyltransferase [Gemmatimonadaceae bacterium]|nr:GNAT family N-acetyltransferase [Phycisphaerales bacterium]NUQ12392.1 GNAT family N-acetyltransferase [Gemmatimonadaceae bacterium]